jgi:hypothetical protein
MSSYLYCSLCGNTEYEVLYDELRSNFFIECNNPRCGWTALVHGEYIPDGATG